VKDLYYPFLNGGVSIKMCPPAAPSGTTGKYLCSFAISVQKIQRKIQTQRETVIPSQGISAPEGGSAALSVPGGQEQGKGEREGSSVW